MTQIFRSIDEWLQFKKTISGKTLGFVPTMGALHEGHISLLRRSMNENELTMASIFVNPTQFNDPNDLTNYPKTPKEDLALLESAGVHFLFCPEISDLYPDQYRYQVTEKEESKVLCGAHRPGHFDGVLTIVLKLLNLSQANRAYFGEKDFQQLRLIQGMARAFFIPTEIISCPTLRESDGLAMSSRNRRLTPEQREHARTFPKILKEAPSVESAIQELKNQHFEVDYVEERWGRRLGAVRLGAVRLIDHV